MLQYLNRRQMLSLAVAAVTSIRFAQSAPDGDALPTTGTANKQLLPFDDLMIGLVSRNKLPGASLAVMRQGQLVYARGFGYANLETRTPVQPTSLFRIASISKPITAVAVLQLAGKKLLKLDDPVLDHLKLKPFLAGTDKQDPRWKSITIRHCLQHTGGWDRARSYDPCFRIWEITKEMDTATCPPPDQIVRYMLGKPLDFNPGERYAYSNLGYLVLGEIIEAVSQQTYVNYVRQNVLAPLNLTAPQLGRVFPRDRPKNEVSYYDSAKGSGRCLYPPKVGEMVPTPDGAMNVEAFAAHGGWIASAVDLVRFASAFDYDRKSPLLSSELIEEMWARPAGNAGKGKDGKPKAAYYGCGWNVRPIGDRGRANTWHTGLIPGTSTLLVRRHDGLSWAALFNSDRLPEKKKIISGEIDAPLHEAADAVKEWPRAETVVP